MAFQLLRSEGNVWIKDTTLNDTVSLYCRVEYELNETYTSYRLRVTMFIRRNSVYSGRYWFHYNLFYSTHAEQDIEFKPGGSQNDYYQDYSWWSSNYGNSSYNDPIEFITGWVPCGPGILEPYLRIYSEQTGMDWTLPGESFPINVPNPYSPPTAPTIYVNGGTDIQVDSKHTNYILTASGGSESIGGGSNYVRIWYNAGGGWKQLGVGTNITTSLAVVNSNIERGKTIQYSASRFNDIGADSGLGNVVSVLYKAANINVYQIEGQPSDVIRYSYDSNLPVTLVERAMIGSDGNYVPVVIDSGKPVDIIRIKCRYNVC